jgi:UDP-N-acetyl-2-amino-2-deoxyglucuronate dehydrogenase
VGVLDSYFPDCDFFTEFERLDRHCDKLKRQGTKIDYVVVCSPNYLHDAHIRFGLRIGADVICEKPVVLNPWNVDALMEMEKETGKKVFVIHQLRYHPEIIALKEKVLNGPKDKIYNVNLQYITPRGNWYQYSWKGDERKSGGIISNIGLHFFDILLWVFGEVKENAVYEYSLERAKGRLLLEKANINWFLSINNNDLPKHFKEKNETGFREFEIEGIVINFSKGVQNLHTESYLHIINCNGIGLKEIKKVISFLNKFRVKKNI